MPQYKKVFDIGTYTGNGGIYRVGIPTIRLPGPSGKQVANSIRFRQSVSAYMQRTSAATVTDGKKFTVSVWIKGRLSSPVQNRTTIYATTSNNGLISLDNYSYTQKMFVRHDAVNDIRFDYIMDDQSRWYHLMIVTDTTSATAAERTVAYIDGKKIYSTAGSQPSQNYAGYINATSTTNWIGYDVNNWYSDMYMSEYYFIDGQALTPSSFGEFNSDGIWVPKAYSGTYGTNGFYLKFAAGAAGNDSSGNGNTWTLNGFNVTTANTTYDIMTDSPTDYLSGSMTTANNAGNYSTFNPTNAFSGHNSGGSLAGGATFTNANLRVYRTQNDNRAFSTLPMRSGKWYWEFLIEGTTRTSLGISSSLMSAAAAGDEYARSGDYGYVCEAGQSKFVAGVPTGSQTYFSSVWTTNDLIGVAFDADNGKLYLSKNGTWGNSGNPATDTNPLITSIPTADYFAFWAGGGDYPSSATLQGTINFGQRTFAYTPPTGFKSLNTYNITRPADSSLWFYGDTPDLMWMKNRSATSSLTFFDTVRGPGLALPIPSGPAQSSYGVTEINKFGVSIINDATGVLNGSGNSHVYWGWKAGSNTSSTSVTNTAGSQTSQVSANPAAGFSIVSVTGVATGSFTAGHGLGAAPNFIIAKNLGSGGGGGPVYHSSLGATGAVQIESTGAFSVTSAYWNNTAPTSSVFTSAIGWGATPQIFYCWTAIPGYSAFGSYAGNGVADGPFVYTGFSPRWLMIKLTSAANENWQIIDTSRGLYNSTLNQLYADLTLQEASGANRAIDILSNGFKIRGINAGINTVNQTYIYAAFAEIPFKYARAR